MQLRKEPWGIFNEATIDCTIEPSRIKAQRFGRGLCDLPDRRAGKRSA